MVLQSQQQQQKHREWRKTVQSLPEMATEMKKMLPFPVMKKMDANRIRPSKDSTLLKSQLMSLKTTDTKPRQDLAMITENGPTKILSSPAVQVSGKRRTRKREGATKGERSRWKATVSNSADRIPRTPVDSTMTTIHSIR